MDTASIPDQPGRLKFYRGVSAHLAFLPPSSATACPLCQGALRGEAGQLSQCERCGQPFHFVCYQAALPAGPEREFFAGPDPEPPYVGLFLCGGCRS